MDQDVGSRYDDLEEIKREHDKVGARQGKGDCSDVKRDSEQLAEDRRWVLWLRIGSHGK